MQSFDEPSELFAEMIAMAAAAGAASRPSTIEPIEPSQRSLPNDFFHDCDGNVSISA